MKSFLNTVDRKDTLDRLNNVRPDSQRRWGRMKPQHMIWLLSDSFKVAMGEKKNSSVSNPLTCAVVKWIAIYAPLPWPHGARTMPEMDQEIGGTPPTEFDHDPGQSLYLIERFTSPSREIECE